MSLSSQASLVPPKAAGPLPSDVLLEICRFFTSQADILHLALTSSHTFHDVAPALFSDVALTSFDQTLTTLGMFCRSPSLSRYIRRLSISPTFKAQYNPSHSALASALVRDLASTLHLVGLTTFIWDDVEIPVHDEVWFSLRVGCPQLINVSLTLGYLLPSPSSHLYDFVSLKAFSLNLTSDFFHHNGDHYFSGFHEQEKHPLWAMLERCVDLEELSILGSSPTPIDAHWLTHNRWPKLRRLHLGDIFIDWVPRQAQSSTPNSQRPFVSFLEAHTQLQSLALSPHSIDHHNLSAWGPRTSHIESFQGTLQQVQSLPDELCSTIKSLTFCEPLSTREVNGFTLAGVLQTLPNLEELRVCFTLHCMYYDCNSLLRSLVNGAPHLRHLELACLQRPSFQIESFSKTIRGFLKLSSLNLIIVRYPGDDPLPEAAARFARMNPRITGFRLTHISSETTGTVPFHPKSIFSSSSSTFTDTSSSSVASSSRKDITSLATATGFFAVTTDSFGLPLYLNAHVRCKCTWLWGLRESSCTTRYKSDLRPPGALGASRGGVWSMMLERSAAGEEIRMFAFCSLLVTVAVAGFWSGIHYP